MATFRPPFAYNTGGPISGTTQYDDLVVGNIEVDYSSDYGGIKWWGSPEELTGYIIGNVRPGGQPVPSGVSGVGTVGFWRTKGRTDQAFLDLANYIGAKNGQPTFNTTNDAEVWLESNGYYTSYNLPTPTPTATSQSTVTPTPTNTMTPTVTQTPTNTNTPSVTTSQTVTPTPSITASQTATPTNTMTNTPTVTPTNPALLQMLNQTTGSRTITSLQLDGNTQALTSGSYPITAGNNGYALTHGVNVGVNGVVFNFGGSGPFDLYSYLNGTLVNYLSSYNSSAYTMGGTILTLSDQLLLRITDPGSLPTPTTTTTPTVTPTRTLTPTPTNTPNLQGFSYPNFVSTAGITLVGAAAVSGGTIIALTTTSSASVGNMYRTTAIQYNRNFSAQWSSFIGGGTGADGYCVQWTTTNNTNGNSGGSVGRLETSSTINAIGFYTFTSNNFQWWKNNILQSTTSVSSGFWRQQLYFWADYNNSAQTLALYYNTTNSKPGSPNQTFTSFSFDTGSYYMGFGAAIGGSNDNQEILSWNLQFT